MKSTILATGAVLAIAGAATAGTSIGTLTINNTGPFGEPVGGVYTVGTTQTFTDSFGFSFDVLPATLPGFDIALELDFTNFGYSDFAGEISSLNIDGVTPDILPDSFAIFGGDAATAIGFSLISGGSSASGDWFADDALVFDPAGGGAVSVFVGFNKIPTPGTIAGFGLLGLAATRRRR